MNTKMQSQKISKKEKIEKIKDAVDYNIKENGYFQILGKNNILIKGDKYTIFDNEGKTYIFVYENNLRTYIIMPIDFIKYIAPVFVKIN